MSRRRWLVPAVAAVLVTTGGTAWAAFTDTAATTSGSLTAGSVSVPVTPTVAQQTTTGTATVTWTATAVTTGGGNTTASSYEVYRYPAATGGTGTLVCSTAALTCTDAKQAGTFHYAVTARFATAWLTEGARRSYTADAAGPVVVFTRPTDGYSSTASGLRTYVNCTGNAPACGTVSDASALTSVEYTLRSNPNASPADSCWSGVAFVVTTGACTFAATTGTTAWRLPGLETVSYANGTPGVFTLTIRATDVYGNVTTTAIMFTTTS